MGAKTFREFDKSPGHCFKGGGFFYTLSGFGKRRLVAVDFEKSCNLIGYVQKRKLKRFRKKNILEYFYQNF